MLVHSVTSLDDAIDIHSYVFLRKKLYCTDEKQQRDIGCYLCLRSSRFGQVFDPIHRRRNLMGEPCPQQYVVYVSSLMYFDFYFYFLTY